MKISEYFKRIEELLTEKAGGTVMDLQLNDKVLNEIMTTLMNSTKGRLNPVVVKDDIRRTYWSLF